MNLFRKIRDKIHKSCKKSKDKAIPKKPYKDGEYRMSWHSIQRMNQRVITKGDVHFNLHTTPLKKTKLTYDEFGRPSYRRYGYNRLATQINPKSNVVATTFWYRDKLFERFMEERKSMKRYSPEVDRFIRKYVCPILNYSDYNADNIGEIADYIFEKIEGPFASRIAYGDVLSDEQKRLFDIATKAGDEINSRYDWDNWK